MARSCCSSERSAAPCRSGSSVVYTLSPCSYSWRPNCASSCWRTHSTKYGALLAAAAGLPLVGEIQRIRARQAGLGVAHHRGPAHQLDHGVAPRDGALRIAARIVPLGPLGQRRQRGRLGQVEVASRLPEVLLGRRLHAVGAVAQIDLIEVQLEDAVLGVLGLDRARDLGFFELADQGLLACERLGKEIARELHGDRREPLRVPARRDVARRRRPPPAPSRCRGG